MLLRFWLSSFCWAWRTATINLKLRAITLAAVPLLILVAVVTVAHADHLFGTSSGFTKAKLPNRQSITIWADPSLHVDVQGVIRPWNQLAGWPLFQQVYTQPADVEFRPDSSTWVECLPSYTEPYTRCIIHAAGNYTPMLIHETGHALGEGDHVTKVSLDYYPVCGPGVDPPCYVNPRVCDDTSHPLYSPYRGIMSYCWGYRMGTDDAAMLTNAGYKTSRYATPTRTPYPWPWRR